MGAFLKLVPAWAWVALAGVLLAGAQQLRVMGLQGALAGEKVAHSDYRTLVAERDRRGAIAAIQETSRRQSAIDEVQRDAAEQLDTARADAAAADSALERLYQRLAAAELRARAAGNAITSQLSQAAEAEARVRADVLGRVGAAAGLYAAVADERWVAGTACERAYDSVKGDL